MSASEALKLWKGQTKSTAKDAMELGKLWHSRGHDLLKKDLYARVRFLTCLGAAWKYRMTIERQKMQRIRSANADFDRAMGVAAQGFYDALATYHREGFEVAMLAMKDKGTIDEPALKEGKKVLKRTAKAFKKAVRSIQWPKAP
ncbi:MAG TPA: hypothetical protein EYN06_08955 [Myxococcales bacterium]|nr:hypothetical protein [Myxococcales bacterium]